MRVALDLSALASPQTGIGRYTLGLLGGLGGVPGVTLRAFSAGRMRPHVEPALPHRHVPLPARLVHSAWRALGWPAADTLVGGADVVHGPNYVLPPARSAARVVTVHDVAFLRVREHGTARSFARHVAAYCAAADAVIAVSRATRAALLEHVDLDPARVHVVYEGVDVPWGDTGTARETVGRAAGLRGPFLLYVGGTNPRKNVPGLVEAFSEVAKTLPHLLVIVGAPGADEGRVGEAVRRAGLESRVRRLGYVNEPLLGALYRAAEVFVLSSHDEGFGLPPLEAMACGCPVVATRVGALPEVLGNAAVLVPPGDVRALADALRVLAGDDARREMLGKAGRAHAAAFSWERCAAETLQVYRSACGCA